MGTTHQPAEGKRKLRRAFAQGALGAVCCFAVLSGFTYNLTSGSTIGLYMTIALIGTGLLCFVAAGVSLLGAVKARRPAVETIRLERRDRNKAA